MLRSPLAARTRGSLIVTFAGAALATLLGSLPAAGSAMQWDPTPAPSPLQRFPVELIERAFWTCDYAATMRGMTSDEAATCSIVNAELKQRRFNGDFEQMQVWWAENKAAEHRRLVDQTSDVG